MSASAVMSRRLATQRRPNACAVASDHSENMTPTRSVTGLDASGSRLAGTNRARVGYSFVMHQHTRRRRRPTCQQPGPRCRVGHRAGASGRRYSTLCQSATLTAMSTAPRVTAATASAHRPV
jgi:hypothetical protein